MRVYWGLGSSNFSSSVVAVVVVTGESRHCCCVGWASLESGEGAGLFSAGAGLGAGS